MLVPTAPLLAALAARLVPRHGALAATVAAVPSVALALFPPDRALDLPWLLLGVELGIDALRRPLLLLAGCLWLLAAVYARAYHRADPRSRPLFVFFSLTMSGNLGLVVAFDAVTFYLSFVLMNLSAYGLIRHAGNAEARRAAKVYIVLVIAGEGLILPALWLGASAADSLALADVRAAVAAHPLQSWIVGLLFFGFGIKAGALPLHIWLPLAHPVAPTPASAVLSGMMIKAGLLAWLVFLPLAEASLPGWGLAWVIFGLAAAYYGALMGVLQDRPKTVLAYSSISQMGLMTVAVGLALAAAPGPAHGAEAAKAAMMAAVVYAVHHGFAKGALFLGTGLTDHTSGRGRLVVVALLALPALALAGLPPTTGLAAKAVLKDATAVAMPAWQNWLDPLLALAAVGTTLLLARFLVVVAGPAANSAPGPAGFGLWGPWLATLAAAAGAAWLPFVIPAGPAAEAFTAGSLADAAWPVAVGAGVALMVWRFFLARPRARPIVVPAGDILVLLEPVGRCLEKMGRDTVRRLGTMDGRWAWLGHVLLVYVRFAEGRLCRLERRLASWPILVAGFGMLLLLVGVIAYNGR
ncbi:MAG: hypothetical protein EA405_14010 [Rhodospirillales bacterium]|nr:MAG: hypothetical protein EA405_14010 [Rhodospirillales bacterium]